MKIDDLKDKAAKFIQEKYKLMDPRTYNKIVCTDENGFHVIGLDEIAAEFTLSILSTKEEKEERNVCEVDHELYYASSNLVKCINCDFNHYVNPNM